MTGHLLRRAKVFCAKKTQMENFSGKAALITGASSGIGRALAVEFAKYKIDLALLGRRMKLLTELAEELERNGVRALAVSCDVTKEDDLERAVDLIRERWGHLDIVVANAGFGVVGNLARLNLEDYRRQFETNVFGVLRTIYATLEDLKRSRGRLAILGSVAGYAALPGNSAYIMSKFAVRALARSIDYEFSPMGISVTHIAPGFVASEIRGVDNRGVWHPKADNRFPAWLVMPTEKAAKQMVVAILKRKRERVITLHGKAAVFLERHIPGLFSLIIRALGIRARYEAK